LQLELHWLAHVHDVHDVHGWHHLTGTVLRPVRPTSPVCVFTADGHALQLPAVEEPLIMDVGPDLDV